MSILKAHIKFGLANQDVASREEKTGRTQHLTRPNSPRKPAAAPAGAESARHNCLPLEVEEGGETRALACIILTDVGMYVRSEEPIADRTPVRVKFTLPRSIETIEVAGEVLPLSLCHPALGNEAGFGILFQDLSEENRRRIKNYIAWSQAGESPWVPDLDPHGMTNPLLASFVPIAGGAERSA